MKYLNILILTVAVSVYGHGDVVPANSHVGSLSDGRDDPREANPIGRRSEESATDGTFASFDDPTGPAGERRHLSVSEVEVRLHLEIDLLSAVQ